MPSQNRRADGRICLWEIDCLFKTRDPDLAASMRCRIGNDVFCRPCLDKMDAEADRVAS